MSIPAPCEIDRVMTHDFTCDYRTIEFILLVVDNYGPTKMFQAIVDQQPGLHEAAQHPLRQPSLPCLNPAPIGVGTGIAIGIAIENRRNIFAQLPHWPVKLFVAPCAVTGHVSACCQLKWDLRFNI